MKLKNTQLMKPKFIKIESYDDYILNFEMKLLKFVPCKVTIYVSKLIMDTNKRSYVGYPIDGTETMIIDVFNNGIYVGNVDNWKFRYIGVYYDGIVREIPDIIIYVRNIDDEDDDFLPEVEIDMEKLQLDRVVFGKTIVKNVYVFQNVFDIMKIEMEPVNQWEKYGLDLTSPWKNKGDLVIGDYFEIMVYVESVGDDYVVEMRNFSIIKK